MANYKVEKFGIDTKRRNYQKTSNDLEVFNLLKIQTEGFNKFLSQGVKEILEEVYPVKSSNDRILIEFLRYKIEKIRNPEAAIREAKSSGTNYEAKITADFRFTNNVTGEVKEEKNVYIAKLPLMTPGGSFIINGSERIVISQIVRAPGAYFENMKASRAQSSSDASVYKQASMIPNRGAWIEWDYKDYKLLKTPVDEIRLRIDKSKKIKAPLLFYSFGMLPEDLIDLFGESELLQKSIKKANHSIKKAKDSSLKLTKEQKEDENFIFAQKAREIIFKILNTGDRLTIRSVYNLLPSFIFNKRRYDLSETGRYKLNQKLSIAERLLGLTLSEDILSRKGEVLFKEGTKIDLEKVEEIEKEYYEGNIKLLDLKIDPTFIDSLVRYLNISERKAKELNKVILVKAHDIDEDGERVNYNIVGNVATDLEFITFSDIIAGFGYMLNLEEGLMQYDDIDALHNRKVKNLYELLKNQFRIGMTRIEKNLRDRISAKDTSNVTIKNATNHKLMESALKEFFNTSQLSQFMDQINPLAEISNKRRITSLGPGGISRETASLVVRGIHDTHYGRICPIETPEGPNIGLILNLSIYARINQYGLIETPYYRVKNGVVDKKEVLFLTANKERIYIIAPSLKNLGSKGEIEDDTLIVRYKGSFITVSKDEIDLMEVSPKQLASLATSHIPFLEHNDANRALMGANMQRQAVPLIKPEAPIVATGLEQETAKFSPQTITSTVDGVVKSVCATEIEITPDSGGRTEKFLLRKFSRSNQGTSMTQWPRVKEGQKVKVGDQLTDGPSIDNGELALGKNVIVAFTTWRGYNYEDAVILSERLVKDDVYTSLHIEEYKVEQRMTKLGMEEVVSEVPNASKESLRNLGDDGVIIIGSRVKVGDILVGKITPRGDDELSAEEKLLDAILGNKAKNTKDSSLKVPYSGEGIVTDVQILSRENGDKLDDGVEKIFKVYIAQKRKIKPGDKMAGRHGNKAVISTVLPEEDMPYLPDGTPVDVMLNPLGVPSRMNLGQVLEIHLGMAGKILGEKVVTPIFNGVDNNDLKEIMKEAGMPEKGKYILTDGITGKSYDEPVSVGVMYMLKLSHMIDDKMHARSVGPYSLITQQPLRGKSQNGGQRFGEMEAWALEAYGASALLQEMTTIKSDDIHGRNELYSAITKGRKMPKPSIPEGFWVLYYEMRGLGLSLEFMDDKKNIIEINNKI